MRLPLASRGPLLNELIAQARILVLNKADMADEKVNSLWLSYFARQNIKDFDKQQGRENIRAVRRGNRRAQDVLKKAERAGGKRATIGVMVAGVPSNESQPINNLAGRKSAKTGRPGVTTGKQWIRVKSLELLDTPIYGTSLTTRRTVLACILGRREGYRSRRGGAGNIALGFAGQLSRQFKGATSLRALRI